MSHPLRRLKKNALRAMAAALRDGSLGPPYSAMKLSSYGSGDERTAAAEALQALDARGARPEAIGALIDILLEEREATEQAIDSVELVWTGLEEVGSASRDTVVVVRELFAKAQRDVLIATFTIWGGKELFKALGERCQADPDFNVRMFVHVKGDPAVSEAESLRRFAEAFEKYHWPWERKPEVFYDPRTLGPAGKDAVSMHAKCIVIDDELAFIT